MSFSECFHTVICTLLWFNDKEAIICFLKVIITTGYIYAERGLDMPKDSHSTCTCAFKISVMMLDKLIYFTGKTIANKYTKVLIGNNYHTESNCWCIPNPVMTWQLHCSLPRQLLLWHWFPCHHISQQSKWKSGELKCTA